MQISELAQQASVSVHALRHYERLGLIRPDRRANGYRDYPARMRREVVFIAMSRQLGVSLPQIALRLDEYRAGTLGIDGMAQALQARVDAIDQQIAALQSQKSTVQAHQAWLRNPLRQQPQRSSSAARQTRSGTATAPARPWPRVRGPAVRKPSPRDRTTPSPGDNHHDCSSDTPVQRYRVPPPPQAMMEALKGMVLAMPMARTLGLRFVHAEPGRVEVGIPVSEAFSFRPRSVAGHGRVCGGRLCGGGCGR